MRASAQAESDLRGGTIERLARLSWQYKDAILVECRDR
jgi:hypothetical protein